MPQKHWPLQTTMPATELDTHRRLNGWQSFVPYDAQGVLAPGTMGYQKAGLVCLVSHTEKGGFHMSVTAKKRRPGYAEIKMARYELVPDDCHMAMLFPPEAEFVNVHEHCFHLFQLTTAEKAA